MASEDFQGNDSPGTGAEDGRGLIAQVLDQTPHVICVSFKPMIVVLRPMELAAGKAASIVEDNGVVRREIFHHPSEAVGGASSPGDHEHDRAAAVGLIVETSARDFEDTGLDLAVRIRLGHRSAPRGQRQNSYCRKPAAE